MGPKAKEVKKETESLEGLQNEAEKENAPNNVQNVVFQSRVTTPPLKKKRQQVSQRAGLVMPCSRILNQLRKGRYAKHIQRGKPKNQQKFPLIIFAYLVTRLICGAEIYLRLFSLF